MSKPVPKHWKKKYNIRDFESYKDIPGWINDAEFIYKEMVDKAQDGDHFVEIGTFLGQSTTYMAELIKNSQKKNISLMLLIYFGQYHIQLKITKNLDTQNLFMNIITI